jgi:NTE family protein
VYDNMGLEPVWKNHQTILVSDAGGLFDYSGDRGLIRRVLRYTDVVQNQARALRRRWLISSFSAQNPDGTRVLNGTYWGTGSARTSYATGDTVGYSKSFAKDTVARIRTDLDKFSDAEIAVLENHGYLLADIAVQVHAPELYPQPPIPLRTPNKEWMDEEKARKALAI